MAKKQLVSIYIISALVSINIFAGEGGRVKLDLNANSKIEYSEGKTCTDTDRKQKMCFGLGGWIKVIPKMYVKSSFGEGFGGFADANPLQSQVGATLKFGEIENFGLELNYSLLGHVLGSSIYGDAKDSAHELLDEAKHAYSLQAKGDIIAALEAKGLQQGTPIFDKTFNMFWAGAQQQINGVFKQQQAVKEAIMKDRYDDQILRMQFRDVALVYNDGARLARFGWTRAGQGFDPHPLGNEMLSHTGTGSHGMAASPGMAVQNPTIEVGHKFQIDDVLSLEVVAWLNQEGALFVNGAQYLANSFRMDQEMYDHYNDIVQFNVGGVSTCLRKGDNKYCANVQTSSLGTSPGFQLKHEIIENLTAYAVGTYVNHSLQSSGFLGRGQVTWKAFGSQRIEVYFSGFFDYASRVLDFSTNHNWNSTGFINDQKAVGLASEVRIPLYWEGKSLKSYMSFGIEAKYVQADLEHHTSFKNPSAVASTPFDDVVVTGTVQIGLNGQHE